MHTATAPTPLSNVSRGRRRRRPHTLHLAGLVLAGSIVTTHGATWLYQAATADSPTRTAGHTTEVLTSIVVTGVLVGTWALADLIHRPRGGKHAAR